jgi:hypothetical protein
MMKVNTCNGGMKMKLAMIQKIGLGCVVAVGMAGAHLNGKHLSPEGADILKIGVPFTISWVVDVAHGKGTDIAVSRDNGTTWTDIKTGIAEAEGTNTFSWTVTGPAVTQARVRICQQSDTPAPCTDADKSNSPTAAPNGHYVLITSSFKIEEGTAVNDVDRMGGIAIGFDPQSRNVEVSFPLAQAQDVSLQALDLQGRLVATLVQGRYAAGEHKLSVFSNRLEGSAKALVFRLKLGEQVYTRSWTQVDQERGATP